MTAVPPVRSAFKGPFPPGPRAWVPGASLRAMQRDPLGFLTRIAREFGDVAHFTFGPQHLYLINHPDLIRDVLVTKQRAFMKGRALQRTKLLLGEGLLTSEGDFHIRQRRLMQPAFHRDRIARYAEVMRANAERVSESWRDGETMDVAQEMTRLTLSIVAQTLFGADVESEADEIGRALTELMEVFTVLLNPFTQWLMKLPTPKMRSTRRAIERLDATIYRMIEERRASGVDRGDLLSMLLLAQDEGEVMTDRHVRDEAMTLFLAGHETTANALAWTFYLLAQHPDVELRDEHYTRMVLAESMRLYPPAWIIGRLALEPVEIGGYTIPRGAIVIVSQWVMHRDPRYWRDAEKFDPERFRVEDASRPKFAYFPFGGGSRICIGEGFAWTEGVIVLQTLARKWRLELAQSTPVIPKPVITLRPRGGIRMTAHARH
ncbi:MAG TPA: cytochrome P450 [Thermoanaerobaculia bacterium]|nr:cytochrome P450 [Thermoanaerobaculia bacterium]